VRYCQGCLVSTDIIPLVEAAELFETTPESLFRFITDSGCHYETGNDGKTYLCVTSLLEGMQQKTGIRRALATAG
jgi:hypothetical protein